MNIPALAAARRRVAGRVPFHIGDAHAGSVAREHLPELGAWPDALKVSAERVVLVAADRSAALAAINTTLRERDLVRGWRDEAFAISDLASGAHLAVTERAAARFWGTLTLGAHANGYVTDAAGRPAQLWIARRALNKATDPGLLDNLIGGGVPMGQSPHEALLREGWEEAGLVPAQMAGARPAGVLRLHRDIAEGLQLEDLHAFDLPLPAAVIPVNQDGEVAGFECLPVHDAVQLALGDAMTVDAALVTLDFAARHGLGGGSPTMRQAFTQLHRIRQR